MIQRIACTKCGTHRDLIRGGAACPNCGSNEAKTIAPSAGDRLAVEADVIKAAESIDRELLHLGVVHRSSHVARALADACRELALVRTGVCTR